MFASTAFVPARSARTSRAAWTLCLLGLGLGLWACAGRARGDEMDIRDLQHEVIAYKALQDDPLLAQLNLLVRVRKRVATVTGVVPSRELALRAVACLKKLPEIGEVRSTIRVAGESMAATVAQAQSPPKIEPPPVVVWQPVPTPSVALSPPTNPIGAVSRPKEAPRQLPEPPDTAAITSAVKNLMVGEERFRRLRFEVRQNKVYLSGVVYQWADLHEVSRAITRIPGVEAVVLQDVHAEPRK